MHVSWLTILLRKQPEVVQQAACLAHWDKEAGDSCRPVRGGGGGLPPKTACRLTVVVTETDVLAQWTRVT